MPRIAVSDPTVSIGPDGLTDRQAEIVRLTFIEGMKQFRIAQLLRVSPKTVQRDLAAALDLLRTSEQEMSDDIQRQSGRVRMDITIAFAPDQVVTRVDSTLLTVSKILTVPGYRFALYSPDSTPQRIKSIHAAMEGRSAKKWKKRAA